MRKLHFTGQIFLTDEDAEELDALLQDETIPVDELNKRADKIIESYIFLLNTTDITDWEVI